MSLNMQTGAYHVEVLKTDLERRKQKNSRYSLRAYARFLGLDPSSLSKLLKGKQDLSLPVCLRIIRKLKLPTDQRLLFCASVAEEKKIRASHILAQAFNSPAQEISHFSHEFHGPQSILVSSSPDCIYVVSREGAFLYVNAAAAKLLKHPQLEIVGKTAKKLGLPLDFVRIMKKHGAAVIATKRSMAAIVDLTTPSGTQKLEIIFNPVFGDDGEVNSIAGSFHDITHQSRIKEE